MASLMTDHVPLHVFFAYAFRPRSAPYKREEIAAVITEACSAGSALLADRGVKVDLVPSFGLSRYGQALTAEIKQELMKCALCVVDISDNNPNVFFEYGMAEALGLGLVPMKSGLTTGDFPVPSDIAGTHLLMYDSVSDLVDPLAQRLAGLAFDHHLYGRTEDIGRSRLTWCFAGSRTPESINLVAASSATPSPFRDVSSPDFIYLDNLCDKDTLLELSVALSRMYPRSATRLHCSEDMSRALWDEDLVLVGGTGTPDNPNNNVAQALVERLRLPLEYPDVNTLILAGSSYHTQTASGGVVRDYGLFARVVNPFSSDRRVFLVQGIHTYGVLGAAKAFSLHRDSQPNHRLIAAEFGGDREFCAVFPVDVAMGGRVLMPTLDLSQVVGTPVGRT